MRSLRTQLLISHLSLVLIMGVVMSVAIASFFGLGYSIDRLLQSNFKLILDTQEMARGIDRQETAYVKVLAGANANAKIDSDDGWNRFLAALEDANKAATSSKQIAVLSEIHGHAQTLKNESDQFFSENQLSVQPDASAFYEARLRPQSLAIQDEVDQLFLLSRAAIVADNEAAKREADSASWRSLAITALALVIAIILAFRMIRLALTPLAILAKHAENIASGDLKTKVSLPRHDEIGALADSFNEMASKLAQVRRSDVRRLQRAERMTDAALEYLYDPILVTDAKARIFYLNQAAIGLFGNAPASPRRPVEEHITDPRIVRAIQNAVTKNKVAATDDETTIVQIKVGEAQRSYRLRATPMLDPEENLLGAVTVLEDVTHLRQLDRLKTEFIGVASHELRTPVSSLILATQLLQEGAAGQLNDAQLSIVLTQKEDLERLEKLMRDLLDVTKLEAGSTPPRFEVVSAEDLLKSPVEGLKSLSEKKNVALGIVVKDGQAKVRADRSQIGRAITNLVVNAIRHTPAGGKVKVRAEASSQGVTFSVEDTGEGIPKEYLHSIFDRFVQVPGATQGGAGLGLSIVQNIVKAHGGHMKVESEIGQGSIFSFTLPREDAALDGEDTV